MDTMLENDFYWRFHPSIGADVAICKSFQQFCTFKMPPKKSFFQSKLNLAEFKLVGFCKDKALFRAF
jgi:hypothetical protein